MYVAYSISALLMGSKDSKDKYLGVDLKIGAWHTVSEHSRVLIVLGLMELQWNQRHELGLGCRWGSQEASRRMNAGTQTMLASEFLT